MTGEKDSNKKLCCFIIPYFGRLPKTMALFLKTCEYNLNYNWIIFTDDDISIVPPSNVEIIKCSFESIKKRIQTCFSFDIVLDTPKKLCDFKPAYGYIFKEELSQYRFWGYCDVDQYFGCLENFIPESLLEEYDKLFSLGHMTIYRNTPEINNLFFMKSQNPVHREKSCVEIFASKENKSFDEWPRNSVSINHITEQQKIKTYYCDKIGDIKPHMSKFLNTIFVPEKHQWIFDDIGKHVVVWDNGRIYAAWLNLDKTIGYKELLYVHIQKRNLKILDYNNLSLFVIYPNVIRILRENVNDIDKLQIIRNCLRRQDYRSVAKIDETRYRLTEAFNQLLYYCKKCILRE